MNDSTNVRIIADNIKKLFSKCSGQDSRISDLEDAVARIPEDYSSTTGTKTGQKWIDGKEIYQAVFTGTVPGSGEPAASFSLDYDSIIMLEGITTNQSGNIYDADHYLTIGAASSSIRVSGATYAGNTFVVIVKYTVPDPSPSVTSTKKKTTKKG